jgi:hypothetical protein
MEKTLRPAQDKLCCHCSSAFTVTKEDLAFYDRVSPMFNGKKQAISAPILCPDCRLQRRLSYRNEHSLHHRQCSKSGKSIISMYQSNVPFPVYENDEWWKDEWDALAFGRDVDLTRPFSVQFQELFRTVPKMARIQQGENPNSQYCNCASYNKNCYLLFSSNGDEDCLYGTWVNESRSCMDCYGVLGCELCIECINCNKCYRSHHLQDCTNCSDSAFLKDCSGCRNCFGCVNLRNKEYCVLNEQLTPEQYKKRMSELRLSSNKTLQLARSIVHKSAMRFPRKEYQGHSNEEVTGNYMLHCRRTYDSYDVEDLEDCRYCVSFNKGKDAMDVSYYGGSASNELLLECEGIGHGTQRVLFSKLIWGGSADILYSYECFSSSHLFGCIGLRKKSYCILNKQYTKEEYETLVPKIIERMKKDGEWGEFFPSAHSPFGYNETVAQEYFPLTKEEATKRQWQWHEEEDTKDQYLGPPVAIPDDIKDVSDEITKQILLCQATMKPYKIIPQELKFYREIGLAIPRVCPDERHRQRLALRNPRKLWKRNCAKCKKDMQTNYASDRPETVYCERCYLETVY